MKLEVVDEFVHPDKTLNKDRKMSEGALKCGNIGRKVGEHMRSAVMN